MGVDQQCLRARAKARKMAVERAGVGMVRLAAMVYISKGDDPHGFPEGGGHAVTPLLVAVG